MRDNRSGKSDPNRDSTDEITNEPTRPPKPSGGLRDRIRALPGGRTALRLVIAVLGGAFVALGLLLVPLPGPGWAIVFGGLAIWAVEFAWARNLLNWVRARVRRWTGRVKQLPWPLRALLAVVSLAGLVTVGWWWIGHRYGFRTVSQFWEFLTEY
jgi:uncharacterized protein (TIGR02611 family)